MGKLRLTMAILATGAVVAQAQTTFINVTGDISVTGNWNNGMPLIGNQGSLAMEANRAADVDMDGWDIVIATGGTLIDDQGSYNAREMTGGSILEIQTGGTYTRDNATHNNALRMDGNSTITVSGGTLILAGIVGWRDVAGGFFVDVTGGTFTSAKLVNYNNSTDTAPATISVSHGTASLGFGVSPADIRAIDEENVFFNVGSGGSLALSALNYAAGANDTNIVVTITANGVFTTDVFDQYANATALPDRYINFATDDQTASWTWTGKNVDDFEALWTAGTLRHNGSSSGSFGDHFVVVDDMVSPTIPPETTAFNNGSGDGTWANTLNWDNGVPGVDKGASVNGGLTANLASGTGIALSLSAGSVDGESGTVENGSLSIARSTLIGVASNATGVVNVTAITAGTVEDSLSIGTGDDASGSLVSDSGAIIGNTLFVGSGAGAFGEVDMGIGSLSFGSRGLVGSGIGATGTVDAASFTLSGSADLAIGSASNATGRVTAGNGSVDTDLLFIGSGQDAVGILNLGIGTVTNHAGMEIASGKGSTAMLIASTLILVDGADLEVASGRDSTATFTLDNPIAIDSTNGLFIGTGAGSSHNLVAGDFSVTGPIGDLGIGEGTGTEIIALINANDSYGSLTINDAFTFTAGTHTVASLMVNDALAVSGGTFTLLPSNTISVASIESANASLDLADIGSGEMVVGFVDMGRGAQSIGSLTYTNGNLNIVSSMEVGTGGNGSESTVTLKSLTGNYISICHATSIGATGTVTVAEDIKIRTVRMGQGVATKSTLTVGGTLDVGLYLNLDKNGSNSTSTVVSDALYLTNGYHNVEVATAVGTISRLTADSGALQINDLFVATASDAQGLFAITNGIGSIGNMQIATGDNSVGTVLLAITSSATNNVVIGTGSNAVGTLTLPGGVLAAADLTLGGAGTGAGTITLAGGDLVVTGALSTDNSSCIDVTDNASTVTWVGKTSADFEALWATGVLRFAGESGLAGEPFSNYFHVVGDVLGKTPVGIIAIANGVGGVDISWESLNGTSYNVETNASLVIPDGWLFQSSVVGNGGTTTVTIPDIGDETFFRVRAL